MQALISKAVTLVQYSVVGAVMFGEQLFPALGFSEMPALYQQWKDKKFPVAMGTWIVGNMIQNSLSSTGAFEVFCNGQLVSLQVSLAVSTS
jgi:thioredoxin reductase-like selenoprotein T